MHQQARNPYETPFQWKPAGPSGWHPAWGGSMDGFTAKEQLPQVHSTEPLRGWRCWKLGYTYTELEGEVIVYQEPRLVSIAINPEGLDQTPWPPMVRSEAIHWGNAKEEAEKIPGPQCTCGYWAYREREKLAGQYGENPYCFGEVSLWGRVVEGSMGYRAQFAYPMSFHISRVVQELWNELLGEGRDIVRELAKTYAVEATAFETVSFK